MIARLHQHSKGGSEPVNMREWFNYTTFDVIGDLGFGSSFDCLRHSDYHPWVHVITHNLFIDGLMQALTNVGLHALVRGLSLLNQGYEKQSEFLRAKVAQRSKYLVLYTLATRESDSANDLWRFEVDLHTERPDFMEGLINKKDQLVSFCLPLSSTRRHPSMIILRLSSVNT